MTVFGVAMVTFRGGDAPVRALGAIERARAALGAGGEVRAAVVDNASGDGTAARVRAAAPWADAVALAHNGGFAAGINVALGRLGGCDVLVLLNPDVEVAEDFFTRLDALDWPRDLAARGPLVIDADGRTEQSARGFPGARTALLGRSSLLARLRPGSALLRRDLLADASGGRRRVDWVSGACLIAPAARLAEVGPLDEGYFMYWEDADWCRRAHVLGLGVLYEPALVVRHAQGSSSRERPVAATIAFHRSALRYWRKHVARSRLSVAAAAVALAARCLVKLIAVGLRVGR